MKKILALFVILLAAYGAEAQRQTATPAPAPTEEAVEATAEAAAQATEEAARLSDVYTDLPQSRTEDGGFVLGDPDAPVTLIVFSDWACPHCQNYHQAIEPMLTEYLLSGQVNFETRMLPTAGGMVTVYAGTLAECADDMSEGGFWDSYFTLYELALAGDYDPYIITTTIADDLDLDPDELYACTEEIRQVRTDVELAQEHGIQGTPAVMIRYGDGDPEFVQSDGVTFNRGSVPEEVLRQVIESAPAAEATPESSD